MPRLAVETIQTAQEETGLGRIANASAPIAKAGTGELQQYKTAPAQNAAQYTAKTATGFTDADGGFKVKWQPGVKVLIVNLGAEATVALKGGDSPAIEAVGLTAPDDGTWTIGANTRAIRRIDSYFEKDGYFEIVGNKDNLFFSFFV